MADSNSQQALTTEQTDQQKLYDQESQRRSDERAKSDSNWVNILLPPAAAHGPYGTLWQTMEKLFGIPQSYTLLDPNDPASYNLGDLQNLGDGQSSYTYTGSDADAKFGENVLNGEGSLARNENGSLTYHVTGSSAHIRGIRSSIFTDRHIEPIDNVKVDISGIAHGLVNGKLPALPGVASGTVDRSAFWAQLKNPEIMAAFAARVHSEVGSQGVLAQQAFAETIFNRATTRGQSLMTTLSGSYYPTSDPGRRNDPALEAVINNVAYNGTNITNLATGNASGSVGFGGGPTNFASNGERFGRELADIANLSKIKFGAPVLQVSADGKFEANEATLKSYIVYLKSIEEKIGDDKKPEVQELEKAFSEKLTEVQKLKNPTAPTTADTKATATDPAKPSTTMKPDAAKDAVKQDNDKATTPKAQAPDGKKPADLTTPPKPAAAPAPHM